MVKLSDLKVGGIYNLSDGNYFLVTEVTPESIWGLECLCGGSEIRRVGYLTSWNSSDFNSVVEDRRAAIECFLDVLEEMENKWKKTKASVDALALELHTCPIGFS